MSSIFYAGHWSTLSWQEIFYLFQAKYFQLKNIDCQKIIMLQLIGKLDILVLMPSLFSEATVSYQPSSGSIKVVSSDSNVSNISG